MPTYKDLLGMLRSAISRSVNIIAFDEGETNENGVHEDYIKIVRAVDGPLTTLAVSYTHLTLPTTSRV